MKKLIITLLALCLCVPLIPVPIGAAQAAGARGRVKAVFTDRRAAPAADALVGIAQQLRPDGQPLGIVAPEAAQVAAFQKDRRADARAVVQGKALNVKNRSLQADPSSYCRRSRRRAPCTQAAGRA